MDTSKHSVLEITKNRNPRAAFSLIEVVMAIGIVAFAFISVLGLIPTGLNTFRQAIDASVGAQIVQRVMNEAQQTDFDVLVQGSNGTYLQRPVRYFDDQGNEMANSTGAIYQVNTRIMPVTPMPSHTSYPTLATVTVQIVNNPGNQQINTDGASSLWSDPRFSVATYSGLVSRNR